MFRICDSETGDVIFETPNIQELSDYLVDKQMKYIVVTPNEEELEQCQRLKA